MQQITINLSLDDLGLDKKVDVIININGNKQYDSMAVSASAAIQKVGCHEREETSVFQFIMGTIRMLHRNGRIRTAETHQSTLNSFRRFRQNQDLSFADIDADMMESYQDWLKGNAVHLNTISFYMRILRSCYNRAVRQRLTHDRQPFAHVCTSSSKTAKRAVSISTLKSITQFHSASGYMQFARDMFLFSFFMRGMSFIDMAYLKRSDLNNGMVTYSRRKTGQRISVRWTTELQAIIDRHPSSNSLYLLPIISKLNGKERNQMRHHQYRINQCLRQLSETLHTEQPLTMYVARHSWASVAREVGVPLPVISSAMGHESEKTTYVYLKEMAASTIDNANRKVIDSVIRQGEESAPTGRH